VTTQNPFKELEEAVREILPPACELAKVEVEGPQVVLYLKNIPAFYQDEHLITKLASRVRKKIVIRSDASSLTPPTEAVKKIKEIIPVEAGITNLQLDPVFHEAVIEALKPGLVIGKGGTTLKQIILQTGWSPRVLRAPTQPSEIVKSVRASLLHHSEERKKFLTNLGKTMIQPSSGSEWIKITALGAFREVGRSCMLLQTPKSNVLIDCGMNTDTTDNARAYPYLSAMNLSLDQIDAVILTHAHIDHVGFVPYLYAYGYNGPVYCTPPTRDLAVLLQQDSVHVMTAEGKESPYHEKDIKSMLMHTIVRDYGEVTDVTPEIRFTFHNAGHILGSAQVHLHIGEGMHNLVLTGDINYGRTRLFEPADTRFPRIETLMMEATYGGKDDIRPSTESSADRLVQIIRETAARRGKVLIPSFAVGRAQELQLVLEEKLRNDNLVVYMDGMSKEASAIHTVYPEYLKRNIQRRILSNDSPFDKPMFKNIGGKDRQAISESDEPAVIIAPSGMLSGGGSLAFLKLLADDPKNSLVFAGYQGAMTLGRKILSGERDVPILDEGHKVKTLKVNMEVFNVDGYSGHSDRSQLLAYVKNLRPRPSRILTLHGEESKCEDLARTLNRMMHVQTQAPMNLDSIRLR
jgi:hypothetical protein